MTGGLVWALALAGGGVVLAAVSRDELVAGWRAARARRAERRRLDREGWHRP